MKRFWQLTLSFSVVLTLVVGLFSNTQAEEQLGQPTDSTSEVSQDGTETNDLTEQPSTVETVSEQNENTFDFSKLSVEQQYEWISQHDLWKSDELGIYLNQLSESQTEALKAYVESMPKVDSTSKTVSFTNAGPLLKAPQRRLRRALAASPTPDGLLLNKQATKVSDNQYKISLEVATTGTVTETTTQKANDIVLVLDQSGSMQESFGSVTRQAALKTAVKSFLDSVHSNYTSQANHRVSIVTFASSATTKAALTEMSASGTNTLKSKIDSLSDSPAGGTQIDDGLSLAQSIIGRSGDASSRNKVVVVFTDGVPGNTGFDIGVANDALATAQALKNNHTTIYTVGIFNGANVNQYYGKYPEYNPTSETGLAGGYWEERGGSDRVDPDIPAANRFMNYLSSNHTSAASSLGLSSAYVWSWWNAYLRYTLTADTLKAQNSGYYLTASDESGLSNIFQSIASKIETPTIQLDATTHVHDIVSPQFNIPANTSSIRVYKQEYLTNGQFASTRQALTGVDVSVDQGTNSMDLTGYNFNDHFLSETAKEDGTYGQKLIIEFTITMKDGFLGGDNVTTNMPGSGIYYNGSLVGSFTSPEVDVPVEPLSVKTTDLNVYYGKKVNDLDILKKMDVRVGDVQLDLTKENYGLEYWQVQYINVQPTIYTSDGQETSFSKVEKFIPNVTDDLSYKVSVQLSTGGQTESQTTNVWNLFVYRPHFMFKDGKINLGEVVGSDYASNVTSVRYLHGDVELTDSASDNGSKPSLKYGFKPLSGVDTSNRVTTSTYVPMKVTGVRFENEYDAALSDMSFDNTSLAEPEGGQFVLKVTSGQLTITKTGGQSSETYVFNVTSDTGKTSQVIIQGNGSKVIKGLAIGHYTVSEDSQWSWRYQCADKAVDISSTQLAASVTMSNTKVNHHWWLTDYTDIVSNKSQWRSS